LAPLAVADPMAGDGPADATISDLKAEGYNVEINWVNGFDTGGQSEVHERCFGDYDAKGADQP